MHSVAADALRRETRRRTRQLSPDARVALAFALGETDIESYRRHARLTRQEAIRRLARRRQRSRRPSACLRGLTA